VGSVNIFDCVKRKFICTSVKFVRLDNGGKVIILGGDYITHCGNRKLI
jgi:hypothetical protein